MSEKEKRPERSWLYKEGEQPRIFEGEDIKTAMDDGWFDSPDTAKEAAEEEAKAKVEADAKKKPGKDKE